LPVWNEAGPDESALASSRMIRRLVPSASPRGRAAERKRHAAQQCGGDQPDGAAWKEGAMAIPPGF
jgi:hypothetical protein